MLSGEVFRPSTYHSSVDTLRVFTHTHLPCRTRFRGPFTFLLFPPTTRPILPPLALRLSPFPPVSVGHLSQLGSFLKPKLRFPLSFGHFGSTQNSLTYYLRLNTKSVGVTDVQSLLRPFLPSPHSPRSIVSVTPPVPYLRHDAWSLVRHFYLPSLL